MCIRDRHAVGGPLPNLVHEALAEKRLRCSENVRAQFLIAADEVLSNIFSYSKSSSVTVAIKADGGEIALTFSDDGIPFDPLTIEDPDLSSPAEERKPGGLGIFITKKLMDEVSYEYLDQKNTLTIHKKVPINFIA